MSEDRRPHDHRGAERPGIAPRGPESRPTPQGRRASDADDRVPRNRALGALGEDLAAAWYEHRGFTVVDRNWHDRRGELDLVCVRDRTVVFVEVKLRRSDRHGGGAAAVGWKKQRRIRGLAAAWLRQRGQYFEGIRFDVVDVDTRGHLKVYEACF